MNPSSHSPWLPARLPDPVWAPLSAGFLLLAVGLIGWAAQQPWLFPSLGPTAFMLAEEPRHRSTRTYNVVAGHMIALGAGLAVVTALGASHAPPVLSSGQLTLVRVWAAVLAIAITSLLLLLIRAAHPPAASTALILALGSFKPTAHDVIAIVVGVLIVAALGEVLRRARIGPENERPT